MHKAWLVAILLLFVTGQAPLRATDAGDLLPQYLRCEYRVNPIGVDVPHPRLSWVLKATDPRQRGKRQTAYQILVAGSRARLLAGTGDEWDTGKVPSDQTIHIEYAGKPLRSQTPYYWKVRVWNETGKPSAWSEVNSWVAGLFSKSEWAAQWITDPDILVPPSAEAEAVRGVNSGYMAVVARDPDTQKWAAVDLGAPAAIDAVRLYPATSFDWQEGSPTTYFPLRFKIEVANQADFSDAKVVVDRTIEDVPDPDIDAEPPTYQFSPTPARYVRLVVTRLRAENELFANFALAELQVLSQGRNLAQGKTVTALDAVEAPGWSQANLVDGVTKPVRRKEIRQPVTCLRKGFNVDGPVRRAYVYVTARGVYELRLNGRRVGDHILAPEWTSYDKRSQYQAYDVTDALHPGKNAIGVMLAHGWYSGRVGLMGRRRIYGKTPELLLHLDVQYANGRRLIVTSDGSWRRTSDGPIRSADVYDGETYDARQEMAGWDLPGFDDKAWKPVVVAGEIGKEELTWQRNDPIRIVRDLEPVAMKEPRPGVYIFDLGQNMVGHVRLKVSGPTGTTMRVRHGEMLTEKGELYTANLRDAWQIDRYVLRGSGVEVFEPHFTYHGFRYVEVTGLPARPAKDTVIGRVFHSAAPGAGEFATSSTLFNQLMSNIVWTQRGNMEGIHTDCPQRPERLGWTGDLQAFSQAAIFNMEMATFYRKFLLDLRDDQLPEGTFPDVTPNPLRVAPDGNPALRSSLLYGSPAWGDAGVIVPWRLWVNYADKQAVAKEYEAAKAWVEFIHHNNPNLLWLTKRGLDPGDWLTADTLMREGWPRTGATVPHEVFATAFFAHSADLLARMAAVLGRADDARQYRELFAQIKEAFNRAYVAPDGQIQGNTQAGYALALHFDLLPESLRPAALEHLLNAFEPYRGHLSTGFHATHRLMLELTRYGRTEEAYRLLNLRDFPSWGLMIDNGATTLWERWDGYVRGRGFQNPGMNSFNHVAFGSVGEWMWRNIIGINPDEEQVGYKHFVLHPRLGGGLTWAKGTYNSIRGPISSDWKIDGQRFVFRVTIPPNTTANVYVPARELAEVREGGRPAQTAAGVKFVRMQEGSAIFEVGSGHYEFTVGPQATARGSSTGGR